MKTPLHWQSENPDALLKHIYQTNFPWLENYVRQHSGTAEDAQDIFQESLVATWVNLRQGRFSGSEDDLNGYLLQICKYKWISHLRSAAHKKTRYTEDPSIFDREVEDVDIQEDQLLKGRMLKSSFKKLGEKCREILGGYYYQRKSLAKIAAEHGNTEDSIKTLKYRCMMQLRKFYLENSQNEL